MCSTWTETKSNCGSRPRSNLLSNVGVRLSRIRENLTQSLKNKSLE